MVRLATGACVYVAGSSVWLANASEPSGRRINLAASLGANLTRVSEATFSPCGLRVAFTTAFAAQRMQALVCVCYVDGSNLVTIPAVRWPFYYAWSPDSRYLTWLSNSSDNQGVTFRVRPAPRPPPSPAARTRPRPPLALWF